MANRKTLSLSDGDILKLDPILKRHNGNFSAAVRELIELGDIMISRFGSIENAEREMYPQKSLPQELVENRYGVILPYSLMQWGLKLLEGFLPPKGSLVTPVHDSVAESLGISPSITAENYKQWEKALNELYPQLGWEVKITIESTDSTLMVSFSGLDPEINRLAQMVLSVRLAFQNPPYRIEELREYLPLVTIYFKRCDSHEEASERLEHVFHSQKDLYDVLQKRRPFIWKLASLLGEFNYEIAVLPSEYMEDLLSGDFSLFLLKLIQRHVGKSVSELSPQELLDALDEVNEIAHLYKKMEKKDYRIVFFHSYDDPESVRKLGSILSEILRQARLTLSMEIAENMLVFRIFPAKTEKPKVLIVEEKLDSLLSLKYELEQGYEVIDAQDGVEALKKAQEKPDIILLNLNLPKMNGLEVYSELRKEKATKDIPVIVMVPEGRSPDSIGIKADEYLVKPFELGDLRGRMESVLQEKSNIEVS
jgi:CheY-like chemotaxis protein